MPDYFDTPSRTELLPPAAIARLAGARARLTDLMSLARAAYEDEIEANRSLKSARDALERTWAYKPNGPTRRRRAADA